MQYAFYPGCVAKGGAPELYNATLAVAGALGIELEELREAACTGAGVLSERNPELADSLNARTFAMAEKLGLPLMNICSTCHGVMSQSNARLRKDPEYLERINHRLAPEGLHYSGNTEIKHLLWVIMEDIGIDRVRELTTNPLGNLSAAPFYGCYIVRPTWVLGYDEKPERVHYLEDLIEALGAHSVEYKGFNQCCGFPILTMNKESSLRMTGTHVLEAQTKGADLMVTPCPLCHLNLDGGQVEAAGVVDEKLNLPVLHLPQLVGLAFGLPLNKLGLTKNIVDTHKVVEKATA